MQRLTQKVSYERSQYEFTKGEQRNYEISQTEMAGQNVPHGTVSEDSLLIMILAL